MSAWEVARWVWTAASGVPAAYLLWNHVISVRSWTSASEPVSEWRLVIGKAAIHAGLASWHPTDCVRVRIGVTHGSSGWATVVAGSGEIVQDTHGMMQFVTGPRVWLEADGDSTDEIAVDSTAAGPINAQLVTGVARAVIWPPSRVRMLLPIPEGHPRNQGSSIEFGGGIVLKNYDAKHPQPSWSQRIKRTWSDAEEVFNAWTKSRGNGDQRQTPDRRDTKPPPEERQ